MDFAKESLGWMKGMAQQQVEQATLAGLLAKRELALTIVEILRTQPDGTAVVLKECHAILDTTASLLRN